MIIHVDLVWKIGGLFSVALKVELAEKNDVLLSLPRIDMNGNRMMEKHEITQVDLERMAAMMAQAIPDLDCPECCDLGWQFQYVEMSARMYQEEWEWMCLANALIQYRSARK